jgi:hypothetical protein
MARELDRLRGGLARRALRVGAHTYEKDVILRRFARAPSGSPGSILGVHAHAPKHQSCSRCLRDDQLGRGRRTIHDCSFACSRPSGSRRNPETNGRRDQHYERVDETVHRFPLIRALACRDPVGSGQPDRRPPSSHCRRFNSRRAPMLIGWRMSRCSNRALTAPRALWARLVVQPKVGFSGEGQRRVLGSAPEGIGLQSGVRRVSAFGDRALAHARTP